MNSYCDHKWRPWRVRGNATSIASAKEWRKPKWWNELAALSATPTRRVMLDVDLFAPDSAVVDSDRSRVWRTIDDTPALTWLVFTRRPESIAESWPNVEPWQESNLRRVAGHHIWYRGNVWLGVDVSTQQEADELIPQLLKCRELCGRLVVRVTVTERIDLFAMCEHHPQDGPYHEGGFWHASDCPSYCDYACGGKEYDGKPIDWLILQGDVGRSARPCNVAHVRELVRQSREAGVPCWTERLGSCVRTDCGCAECWASVPTKFANDGDALRIDLRDPHGADQAEWPKDLRNAREVPT